jgi:sugar/nucleoside kinase (ribokinase family)
LITKSFVDRYVDQVEGGSLIILCSLFQLPNLRLADVAEITSALKNKGCTVLIDPGWDPNNWKPDTVEGVRRLLPLLDYFLPNFEEAGRIAGSDSEAGILRFFNDNRAANVIIKKGASGCLALLNGRIHRSRAYATTAVDTTGAGDVFNAALVYCLGNNIATRRMLDFANAAASLSIARATNRYPPVIEIEAAVTRGLRE